MGANIKKYNKNIYQDLQMFLMGVGMDQQIIDVDKYGEIT